MSTLLCFLVLALINFISASKFTLNGECPAVKKFDSLDESKFAGTWYVVGAYRNDELDTRDCRKIEIYEDKDGISFEESYVDLLLDARTSKHYSGRIDKLAARNVDCDLVLSHRPRYSELVYMIPFHILDTDYEKFAIIYYCKTLKSRARKHSASAFILSRSKQLSEGSRNRVDAILRDNRDLRNAQFTPKDFSTVSCAYKDTFDSSFFTTYL